MSENNESENITFPTDLSGEENSLQKSDDFSVDENLPRGTESFVAEGTLSEGTSGGEVPDGNFDPDLQKSMDDDEENYLTHGYIYLFLSVFTLAFTTFVFIFNVILQPIVVMGISMQPTINNPSYYLSNEDQDHCDLVYYAKESSYETNDIVIVSNADNRYISQPDLSPEDDVTSVIKRVIATPLQTVRFYLVSIGGDSDFDAVLPELTLDPDLRFYYKLEVYDKDGKKVDLDQSYLTEEMYFTWRDLGKSHNPLLSNFTLFYTIFSSLIDSETHDYRYFVEENHYFVMGDNRNHSTDSRFFGAVLYDDIQGSLKLRVAYGSNIFKAIWIKIKSIVR